MCDWFWFTDLVLVRHDESTGGFASGFRSGLRFKLGLLGWWVLATILWQFCGGFWLQFVPWVFFWWLGVEVEVEVVVGGGGRGCGWGRWWQRMLVVVVGLLVVKEM